jgi:hypothetical protein
LSVQAMERLPALGSKQERANYTLVWLCPAPGRSHHPSWVEIKVHDDRPLRGLVNQGGGFWGHQHDGSVTPLSREQYLELAQRSRDQ